MRVSAGRQAGAASTGAVVSTICQRNPVDTDLISEAHSSDLGSQTGSIGGVTPKHVNAASRSRSTLMATSYSSRTSAPRLSRASNDLQLWKLLKGVRSSLVLARKPSSRPGRYCIRLSRVLTSAVSSPMSCLTRLASDRFRTDQTGSVGLPQCMDRCTSGCGHAGYRQGGPASAGRVGRTAAGTRPGGRGGGAGILPR
jgi:hypothetical protein